MQVKTVTFEYGMTYNLGNYSSTKQSVSLTAELSEGDDEGDALDELRNQAANQIRTAINCAKLDFQRANKPTKLDDDVPF